MNYWLLNSDSDDFSFAYLNMRSKDTESRTVEDYTDAEEG